MKKFVNNKILFMILMTFLSIAFLSTGCGNKKKESTPAPPPPPQMTKAQLEEMSNSFNTVLSNNSYNSLYHGVMVKDTYHVYVYVNDNWNYVSKDVKTAFVDLSSTTWRGMIGARNIPYDQSVLFMYFENAASGNRVASWSIHNGATLK